MQAAQFELHAEIEERHWWFVARRRIMRALAEVAVPPLRTSRVVDVGCGTGANLAALANQYLCAGIDTSADAIEKARARFPDIEFIHGFAPADLGQRAGQADLFLLMDVLEHVPDDFQLLSSLLAAARPGAHFLVTVPADQSLWSEHDVSFGHYRRYDLERFRMVWRGLPVTTRLVSYYNSRLFPLVKLSRAISRGRGHTGGRAGTDFWMPASPVNRALEAIFAGESRRLCRLAQRGRGWGYGRGVSLIALLRREEGLIEPRCKPTHIAADYFDPTARSEPLALANV
jgi:SAM-dependent methyltransferase